MRIREVLIRWYKSFNYDYELKANVNAARLQWQQTADGWLPHVRIDLEDDITAVVGANESGKSHLLDAIRIVLTGEGLSLKTTSVVTRRCSRWRRDSAGSPRLALSSS